MPKLRQSIDRAANLNQTADGQPADNPGDNTTSLITSFDKAWRAISPSVNMLSKRGAIAPAGDAGLGGVGCSCSKCLRKAGPVREDSEERIIHITHVLANVYEETTNPDEHITPQHRSRAREFLHAVEANEVEKLDIYFRECADELRGEIVSELIISAAQAGHVDAIKCLSRFALDLDYLDTSDSAKGARPLMFSAHNGHVGAVRLLLELGADPNATDDHGYNALTISTFCDRAGVAEVLCEHKDTIIDQADERDRTALSYAALYGSDNCVHVLASHGADVFHQDDEGADPLDLAEQSGRASTAEALRKLQLKARMAQRRAGRKADAAERAQHILLSESERARRAEEADARAAELLAECLKEEVVKRAEAERQALLRRQQKEAAAIKRGVKNGLGAHARTASNSSQESGHQLTIRAGLEPAGHVDGKAGGAVRTATAVHQEHAEAAEGKVRAVKAMAGNGVPKGAARQGIPQVVVLPAHMGVQPQQQPHQLAGAHAHGAVAQPVGLPLSLENLPPANALEPVLRAGWDAMVTDASTCREPQLQPRFLAALNSLMSHVQAAGISVKWGRKVQQRLEAVTPARIALISALAARPIRSAALEAALKLARPAASLLDAQLMADAEAAVAGAAKVEEEQKWARIKAQMVGFESQMGPDAVANAAKANVTHTPLAGRGSNSGITSPMQPGKTGTRLAVPPAPVGWAPAMPTHHVPVVAPVRRALAPPPPPPGAPPRPLMAVAPPPPPPPAQPAPSSVRHLQGPQQPLSPAPQPVAVAPSPALIAHQQSVGPSAFIATVGPARSSSMGAPSPVLGHSHSSGGSIGASSHSGCERAPPLSIPGFAGLGVSMGLGPGPASHPSSAPGNGGGMMDSRYAAEPCPTAPLSVAAAALGLGGLSIGLHGGGLGMGSDSGAAGFMNGGYRNDGGHAGGGLLAALHTHGGGGTLGASSFGVQGVAIPPGLSALWDRQSQGPSAPSMPQQQHQHQHMQGIGMGALHALHQPQHLPGGQQQHHVQQQHHPLTGLSQQHMYGGGGLGASGLHLPGLSGPGMGGAPRIPQPSHQTQQHMARLPLPGQGGGGVNQAGRGHMGPALMQQAQQQQQQGMQGHPGAPRPTGPMGYNNGMPGNMGPPQPKLMGGPGMMAMGQARLGQAQCVLCHEQSPAAICSPCLHVCMCMRCASHVYGSRGACPLCKSPLNNVYSIAQGVR